MEIVVLACGIHSLAFAVFHALFWKVFNWRKELAGASVATRAIIQIANLRLIHVFLGVSALCFLFPDELVTTGLGRAILIGMSLFWIGRLIEQLIFLPYNRPMIHVLNALFAGGAVLFALPLVL